MNAVGYCSPRAWDDHKNVPQRRAGDKISIQMIIFIGRFLDYFQPHWNKKGKPSAYLRDLADFDCGMTKARPRSLRW